MKMKTQIDGMASRMNQETTKLKTLLTPQTCINFMLCLVIAALSIGCSTLSAVPGDAAKIPLPTGAMGETSTPPQLSQRSTPSNEKRVSNPQAREIRFDGQEFVLGGGDCKSIQIEQLRKQANELRARGRYRSASELVRLHRRTASRWVLESIASSQFAGNRWVATTLDRGTNSGLHTHLCDAVSANPTAAKSFDSARRQTLKSLTEGTITAQQLESLSAATQQLNTMLAYLEAERLYAMAEIVSGQPVAAATRLGKAAEVAARGRSADQCGQLWLLACETHIRADAIDAAAVTWQNAVRAQLTAMTQLNQGNNGLPSIDTVFWEQADRLRPRGADFPQEVALAMNPWKLRIGLDGSQPMKPSASMWSAIAAFQLTTGQPHLATLSIKRAEVNASSQHKPWLQIALARSVAAQGQTPIATTILGSLTTSPNPNIRAAALATLGSVKVQSGAYEQGGKFLIQALAVEGAGNWPGQLGAEADLANVRLIMGDLTQAQEALHAVQQKMVLQGRWQSLVQSLENEATILELENNKASAQRIRQRIAELERQSS